MDRLEVILRLQDRRLSRAEGARILGLSTRQLRRLERAYEADGADGLASKRRGNPSNRKLPGALRADALSLVRDRYADFGPTLAHEKLAELHDVHVSRDTLRRWMIADGLWVPRAQRRRIYQPRHRRDCVGELVQIDGCQHAWFEDRGPKCSVLVFVDDATSRIMQLRFVESESTFDYFDALERYVEAWGRPVALYSDKHSIFRVNAKSPKDGSRVTQFGRALTELNIDLVCANTPQAKGRVERAHLTLQDRLVKELRLRGISDIAAANRFAGAFVADYNRRFGKPARSDHDAHRPVRKTDKLEEILTVQAERKLTKQLTFQYEGAQVLIEPSPGTVWLGGQRVRILRARDGRTTVKYADVALPHRVLRSAGVEPGRVIENKRLDTVLAAVKTRQQASDGCPDSSEGRRLTARERIRRRATGSASTS